MAGTMAGDIVEEVGMMGMATGIEVIAATGAESAVEVP
jgi:hypothetical protein